MPRYPYPLTPLDQKRFAAAIDRLGDHWWWVGAYNNGYPQLRLADGTIARSAALALQLAGTPVPGGHRVRYLCPALGTECVNPEHLSTYNTRSGPWTYVGRPGTRTPGIPPLTGPEIRSLQLGLRQPD